MGSRYKNKDPWKGLGSVRKFILIAGAFLAGIGSAVLPRNADLTFSAPMIQSTAYRIPVMMVTLGLALVFGVIRSIFFERKK